MPSGRDGYRAHSNGEEDIGFLNEATPVAHHILLPDTSLEAHRRDALRQFTIAVQPTRILEYADDGVASIEPHVFYVPLLTNQKALDPFILIATSTMIVSNHDINHGLVPSANCHGFPPMDKWRFVFIMPPDLTLRSLRPWALDMRLLSSC